MQLAHIPLSDLTVSRANARHRRKAPDVSDLAPSIRARGVLQPLLVRRGETGYEIVAGRRRYYALKKIAAEDDIAPDDIKVPCAVMAEKAVAIAAEASLAENVTHLPMQEMEQYEAFARLERQGRSVAEIAASFGIGEPVVRRRLALGALDPKIRAAFKAEAIDGETLQILTLASRRQQKEWLALFDGRDENGEPLDDAPRGHSLRLWLFGGEKLSLKHARFAPERYTGATATDLFGEDVAALDREQFWTLQDEAIAALADRYRTEGWQRVVALPRGQRFQSWSHCRIERDEGGAVFIEARESGEVIAHEGYLEPKQLNRRRAAAAAGPADERTGQNPELSAVAEQYVALHRHAIARAAMLDHPGVALRLALAHLLAGAPLWHVRTEPQTAGKQEIVESVQASRAEAAFRAAQAGARRLLDLPEDADDPVVRANGDGQRGVTIFVRLLALTDAEVLGVLTVAMGETLAAGSAFVEAAGCAVRAKPSEWWRPDACFLPLVRDRAVIDAMLAEVAGDRIARSNLSEKTSVKKRIIADCLAGDGRPKVEGWVPRYLAFPPKAYTPRGTRGVSAAETIAPLLS
jgi:ParB family chromosome partitioning protein